MAQIREPSRALHACRVHPGRCLLASMSSPLNPHSLPWPHKGLSWLLGGPACRRLMGFPGFGSAGFDDSLDALLTRILNAYQAPVQPTARSVRRALPRLRVRPAPEQTNLDAAPILRSHSVELSASSSDVDMSLPGTAAVTQPSISTSQAVLPAEPAEPADSAAKPATRKVVKQGSRAGGITGSAVAEGSSKDTVYAACAPDEACTVCHEAMASGTEVVQLPCSHCFHEDCVMPWLGEHNTCPVCRYALEMEVDPPTSQRARHAGSSRSHRRPPSVPTTAAQSVEPGSDAAEAQPAPAGHSGPSLASQSSVLADAVAAALAAPAAATAVTGEEDSGRAPRVLVRLREESGQGSSSSSDSGGGSSIIGSSESLEDTQDGTQYGRGEAGRAYEEEWEESDESGSYASDTQSNSSNGSNGSSGSSSWEEAVGEELPPAVSGSTTSSPAEPLPHTTEAASAAARDAVATAVVAVEQAAAATSAAAAEMARARSGSGVTQVAIQAAQAASQAVAAAVAAASAAAAASARAGTGNDTSAAEAVAAAVATPGVAAAEPLCDSSRGVDGVPRDPSFEPPSCGSAGRQARAGASNAAAERVNGSADSTPGLDAAGTSQRSARAVTQPHTPSPPAPCLSAPPAPTGSGDEPEAAGVSSGASSSRGWRVGGRVHPTAFPPRARLQARSEARASHGAAAAAAATPLASTPPTTDPTSTGASGATSTAAVTPAGAPTASGRPGGSAGAGNEGQEAVGVALGSSQAAAVPLHLGGSPSGCQETRVTAGCEAGHAAPPAPLAAPPAPLAAPPASAASASAPAPTANPEARSYTAPSATAITPSPHLPSPPSAGTPSSRTLTTHPPPARPPSRATPSSHPPLPPQLLQPRPGTSAFSTANRLEGLLQSEALQDQLPSPAVARQQRRQARLQARYQAAQAWQRQGRQGSGQNQGSVPLPTSQQPTLQQRLARLQERMQQQAEQQQQLGLGNAGSSGQPRGPAAAGQLHVGLDRVRSLTSDSLLLAPFALHPCVAMTSGIVRPGRLVHIPNPPSGDLQGHAPAPHQLPANHEARPAPRPLAIPAHLAFPSNAFLPLPLASATARPSAPLPWNTHSRPSPSAAATSPSPSAGASGGARPASAPLSGLNRGFLAPRGSSSSRQRATAPPVLASPPPLPASSGPGSSPTAGQATQPSSAITTGPAGAHGGRGSAAARPPPGSQAGSSNSLARGFLARPAASTIPRQPPVARAGSLASEPTYAAGSSGGPGGCKGCLSPVVEAQVAGSPGSSSGSLAGMAAGSTEERLRQQSDNQKVAGHTTSRRAAGGQDRACNAGQSAHWENSGGEEDGVGGSGSDSDIPGLLTEEEMGPALHHSADKPACLQQGRQQQGRRSQATDSSRAGGSGQGRGLRSGFMVSRGPGAGTATGASTGLPAAAQASVASGGSAPSASPSQLQDSALDSKNTVMPAASTENAAAGSAAAAAAELQNPQASHTPAPSLGRSPSSGRPTRYASSCCPPASLQPHTSSSSLPNPDAPPSTSTTPGSSASLPSTSSIPAGAPPSTASPSNPSPLPLPLPLHPSFGGEASSSAPLPSLPPLQHPIQVSPAAVQHTLRMLHRTASGATPLDQAVQAAVQELSQEVGQHASPSSRPHQPSPLPLLLDSLTALTSPRELPAVQLVSHTSLPSPRTAGRAGARAAARAAAGTASSPGQAAAGVTAAGGEVVGQGEADLPSPTPGSGGEVSPVVPARGGSGRRSWQLPGSAQRGVLSLPAAHPGVVTYVHDDTLGRTFSTQEPGGGGAGEAGHAGAGDEQAGSAAGERSDAVVFNLPPLALTPLPSVVLSQPPSALTGPASVTSAVPPAQAAPPPASGQEVGKAEEVVTTATVGASSAPGAAGGSKEQAGCAAGPLPVSAGAEGASPAAGAAAISGGDVAGEDASLLLNPPAATSHPGSPVASTPRTAPPVQPGATSSSSSQSSTGGGSRGTGGSPGQANVVNSLARVVAAPVRWLLGLPRRHP
ncbi:hypothetical protein QJQ45_021160 [Haematococcus lacustris]|nr:hypothetical protein QJQ45_021160 [Haematococcus lacustris]